MESKISFFEILDLLKRNIVKMLIFSFLVTGGVYLFYLLVEKDYRVRGELVLEREITSYLDVSFQDIKKSFSIWGLYGFLKYNKGDYEQSFKYLTRLKRQYKEYINFISKIGYGTEVTKEGKVIFFSYGNSVDMAKLFGRAYGAYIINCLKNRIMEIFLDSRIEYFEDKTDLLRKDLRELNWEIAFLKGKVKNVEDFGIQKALTLKNIDVLLGYKFKIHDYEVKRNQYLINSFWYRFYKKYRRIKNKNFSQYFSQEYAKFFDTLKQDNYKQLFEKEKKHELLLYKSKLELIPLKDDLKISDNYSGPALWGLTLLNLLVASFIFSFFVSLFFIFILEGYSKWRH